MSYWLRPGFEGLTKRTEIKEENLLIKKDTVLTI
jgi:hypothetical protein